MAFGGLWGRKFVHLAARNKKKRKKSWWRRRIWRGWRRKRKK